MTNDLRELLVEFQSGDMGVFASIYAEFERLIGFYAKKSGCEDTAQELTVFLLELLWKINPEQCVFEDSEGLKRYIAVSIRNRYIALSKAEQIQSAEFCFFENAEHESTLLDGLGGLMLCEALQRLTQKQRETVLLKYVYEFTNCEIAKKLNISRQAVNQLKNRAIEVLKEYYFKGER